MSSKHKIAVFASGTGSNFKAIVEATHQGRIEAEVVLLVCDRPTAGVCDIAAQMGVPTFAFSAKEYSSKQEYEQHIVNRCRETGVELICLAGYMRIVGEVLLTAYAGHIVNLHPSLLPAFKGARAIEQALEYGVKVFGATIHYVDESLDGGSIIAQRAIAYEGHDLEELTNMIHAIEHELYIDTLKKLLK